jgi:hypothetical protein
MDASTHQSTSSTGITPPDETKGQIETVDYIELESLLNKFPPNHQTKVGSGDISVDQLPLGQLIPEDPPVPNEWLKHSNWNNVKPEYVAGRFPQGPAHNPEGFQDDFQKQWQPTSGPGGAALTLYRFSNAETAATYRDNYIRDACLDGGQVFAPQIPIEAVGYNIRGSWVEAGVVYARGDLVLLAQITHEAGEESDLNGLVLMIRYFDDHITAVYDKVENLHRD